jgi:hypothetical protein
VDKGNELEEDIKKKALERAKYEGLEKHERLKNKGFMYYNNL